MPTSRARLGSRRGVAVTHGGSPFVSRIPEGGSSLRPRLPKRILARGHGTPVIEAPVRQGYRLRRGKRLLLSRCSIYRYPVLVGSGSLQPRQRGRKGGTGHLHSRSRQRAPSRIRLSLILHDRCLPALDLSGKRSTGYHRKSFRTTCVTLLMIDEDIPFRHRLLPVIPHIELPGTFRIIFLRRIGRIRFHTPELPTKHHAVHLQVA